LVSIQGIAIAPSDPDILYARTDSGIWRSGDAGRTWGAPLLWSAEARRINYPNLSAPWEEVRALAINPRNPDALIIATGPSGQVLHRSNDGGKTWKSELAPHSVDTLLIDPENSAILYATGGWRLSRHVGVGEWENVLRANALDPQAVGPEHLTVARGSGRLYISDRAHAAYSDNQGRSWTTIPGACGNLALSDSGASLLSSCVRDTDACRWMTGKLLRSTDAGQHWGSIGAGLPANNNYAYLTYIHPSMPNLVFASIYGDRLFRSQDSGKTWTQVQGLEWRK
jgi:photosystem II stability/assembly factor-like uncharacterized protein